MYPVLEAERIPLLPFSETSVLSVVNLNPQSSTLNATPHNRKSQIANRKIANKTLVRFFGLHRIFVCHIGSSG